MGEKYCRPVKGRQRPVECYLVTRKCNRASAQRGEGTLKAIFYFAILIAAVFVAVKVIPPYVAEYQLKDKISEQARFAVVNHYSDDQIKDSIFRTIQDLDIPAKRDDVKVANTNHGIQISVTYTVPVDFVVYQTDLNFSPTSEGIDIMK
jgi:predicted membrane protein